MPVQNYLCSGFIKVFISTIAFCKPLDRAEILNGYLSESFSVVLAYMPDEHIKEVYGEDTLFPDGLENVPKRFAISKRNDWMISHSDIAVCYAWKITGGAAKFKEKAEKMRLKIIDVQ